MMDLLSRKSGQWRLATLRSRVPLSRRMRFRPREYTIAICTLMLICYFGFATNNFHGARITRWSSAWNEETVSKPQGGKPLPHSTNGDGSERGSLFVERLHQQVFDVQYREIFALTPPDRKFFHINFSINFKPVQVIDPMILPHPTEYDMWVIIARRAPEFDDVESSDERQNEMQSAEGDSAKEESIKNDVRRRSETFVDEQLVCPAARWNEHDGWLDCIATVVPLVQPATDDQRCEGKLDARLFYGPDVPFLSYSSLQRAKCTSVWLQDARSILEDFHFQEFLGPQHFTNVTRMHGLESMKFAKSKSFYFWDSQGEMYVQGSLFPQRSFAMLSPDGTVGEDLASASKHIDQVCYGKYMPSFDPEEEYLEQISNSLSITLCKRTESTCNVDDTNTFIMSLFHLKSYHDDSMYKPYVFLFRHDAPFAMHAIAARPLSVHGRPETYSITSMSWKSHSRKYHGYIDDAIFLGLTIEDSLSGTIDTLASDLLQDLGMC